ncbi:cation:proton antiporter [Rhizobium sp. KVB221]|uniref:Cation:proton antiporter n=1 Tax=Rhizobium setariae TaxID=2801340 RepID=A0A936YMY7_9HYPH|nr:monovalent cation/H(+) antiporter subunit G [Rhizobium setariae]MBL0373393.1 cation:proton antiporter [Rhizobium setariae]
MTNAAADIPAWVAVLISICLIGGAGFALLGSIGLLQMKTFYQRVHPATLGTSLGTGGVMVASIIFFSVLASRPVAHEILIWAFVTVTTPVTYMLLARAALHRDRAEDNDIVPKKPARSD